MGATCSSYSSSLKMYTEAEDCTGMYYQNNTSGPGCYNLAMSVIGIDSIKIDPTAATGGTCAPPTGGEVNAGSPVWGSDVRLCSAPVNSEGCGAAEVCAENPAMPFGAQICIAREGVQNCPAAPSPYTNKSVFYTEYTDTRTCTSCKCNAKNLFCDQRIDLYEAPDCQQEKLEQPMDGFCAAPGFSTVSSYRVSVPSLVPGLPTCAVGSPSTPQGSCAPNAQAGGGAITICCTDG